MISKFLTALSLKTDDNLYAYLPEEIQEEIRAANEATSVYDIP